MQTFKQTFAAAQLWELNVVGKYFVSLQCTNPINVRFYQGGKLLDLGNIQGLLAGLEVFDIAFDRVQIDVTAADTIQIGIGNGNARYNRQNTTTTITNNRQPVTSAMVNSAATVTSANAQLVAANVNRQYLLVQNNSATGNIFLNFGAVATLANGVKIGPGGSYEMPGTQSNQAVNAIGDIASNAAIVIVEG